MNPASTLIVCKLVKQGIFLGLISKQEVLGQMGGKSSAHKLTPDERKVLAEWLIKKLGGALFTLFDTRGYCLTAAGKDLAAAMSYLARIEPKKEFVAWNSMATVERIDYIELFKGAIPFSVLPYIAAYKLALNRHNETPATIQVGTNGNVAGFGLVMYSQTDVRAMESLGETVHTLHDAHLLSSMQHVGGEKLPEGTPVWIVKRGQPALPTPVKHPLMQVTPLPNAWGR